MVEFRPTAAHAYSGTLVVDSTDPAAPEVRVGATGRGK